MKFLNFANQTGRGNGEILFGNDLPKQKQDMNTSKGLSGMLTVLLPSTLNNHGKIMAK